MIKIKRNIKKVNENILNEFQKEFDIELPSDYNDFLLEYNGGIPELNLCEADSIGQITVRYFLGFKLKKNEYNLTYVLSFFKGRLPASFIPIATAEGGNLICLSVAGEIGAVYFWNHEEEVEENQIPNMQNMYKISNNFSGFLDMIEKFDSTKVKVKEEDVLSSWVDPEFLKGLQK